MTRSTPEWVGRTDDAQIPTRVRLRVWERAAGRCQICGRKLSASDKWQVDHVIALVNGGAHAEHNMQVACDWCHKGKTAEDVKVKAKSAKVRARHAGIRPSPRLQGRGFPKAPPQHSATRAIVRRSERTSP